MDALDHAAARLIREADVRAFGTADEAVLMEFWSDAARAAAVAARRAKAKLRPVVSGRAARDEATAAASRLMAKRREVTAQYDKAAKSSSTLDQRLAKLHKDKLDAIDRVAGHVAQRVKAPRTYAVKSAVKSAGRALKRLFVREAEDALEQAAACAVREADARTWARRR